MKSYTLANGFTINLGNYFFITPLSQDGRSEIVYHDNRLPLDYSDYHQIMIALAKVNGHEWCDMVQDVEAVAVQRHSKVKRNGHRP